LSSSIPKALVREFIGLAGVMARLDEWKTPGEPGRLLNPECGRHKVLDRHGCTVARLDGVLQAIIVVLDGRPLNAQDLPSRG